MRFQKGVPRHKQISDWIREKIESGEYEADEKLPSENQFTEQFDVSRVTVRRALQTLENDQLIYRCQGLGSFVQDQRSHQKLGRLTDFMEDMARAGMEASSKVLAFETTQAPARIASILDIEEGKNVMRLDRLRLGDGQPIALDITWLPMMYGQLIDNHNLEEETIFGILESNYDIPVEKGCYRIEAENAHSYLADYLQVDEQTALLQVNRLSLTIGEKPIYYQQRYYRTDRMIYELSVERHPDSKKGEDNMSMRELIPVFNERDL